MSKHYLKKILVVLFTFIILVSQVGISNAANISDIQQQMQEDESNKSEAESQISDLEIEKSDLQSYLSELNSSLNEINNSISELEAKIYEKEQEISINSEKLETTKQLEIIQYEAMKKRIRFMYELQDDNYFEIIMNSGNVIDLINKTEYVNMLVEYDRDMLTKYDNTKKTIIETEEQLEAEKDDLLSLKAEIDAKHNEVATLVEETNNKVDEYQSEIDKAEEIALAYEQKLREKENTIEKLQEEEARRQQEANNSSPIENDYVEQAGDLELLAAIIYCEARGESYEGMLAVGSVVLNRVNSSKFPDTVMGVIYQSGQFSPVAAGTFELALAQGANTTCTQAANEVLNGNITGNWLYFRTVNNIIQGTIIGNHVFY